MDFGLKGWLKATVFVGTVVFASVRTADADVTLVPGDYYTSDFESRTISQYDVNGNAVGSLTLPLSFGSGIQGLTFGPDGLLYATFVRGTDGFAVLALDGSGGV